MLLDNNQMQMEEATNPQTEVWVNLDLVDILNKNTNFIDFHI